MPEANHRLRIGLLAVAVFTAHWVLLAGVPGPPAARNTAGSTWLARTVTPAAPVPQLPDRVAAPAPALPPAVAPAPAAVRKPAGVPQAQWVAASTRAPASSETASPGDNGPRAATGRQAAATPAPRVAIPAPARFHYDVVAHTRGISLSGSAQLDWRHDGREYEAQLTLSAPLLRTRTQRSTGLVTPQGLAPLRFSDKVRSEEAAHFDRDSGKVVFSTNKPQAVLEPGAQDRLSVVLQLGAMIAAQPSRYPAGSHITVQTASTKEAEPWTFTVEGSETLALPGGRVPALRLTRDPRKDYDVKLELWLAPGAAYAPVRLRLTQPNGDWVDQQWSSTDRG